MCQDSFFICWFAVLAQDTFDFCKTSGNGNCLYNACSIALIGDESLANCLRGLTCMELFMNSWYYADHPHFEDLEKSGKVSKNHHL